ncbi:hypothetical protein V7S43_003031 [Phytophthora oleae]|uniref:Secreted protein n=1 Tax=Phytophthora oleae TaxID=2107226 RepID=A0ABD3G163_9STRA
MFVLPPLISLMPSSSLQLLVFLGFISVLGSDFRLLEPVVTHHEAPEETGHEWHQHDVEPLQLQRVEVQYRQQSAQRRKEAYTPATKYSRRRREEPHAKACYQRNVLQSILY